VRERAEHGHASGGRLKVATPTTTEIVITGVAAVSPLGESTAEIAAGLLAGRSGVRAIEAGPPGKATRQFAAPVAQITPPPPGSCRLTEPEFTALDRLTRMCLAPAARALLDAGLTAPARDINNAAGPRIGLVLGLGAEHLKAWELDFAGGGRQVCAAARPASLVHRMHDWLGLDGPAVTAAAACGSSGRAGRRLRHREPHVARGLPQSPGPLPAQR